MNTAIDQTGGDEGTSPPHLKWRIKSLDGGEGRGEGIDGTVLLAQI